MAPAEAQAFAKGVTDPTPFYGSGLKIEGVKFTFLRGDGERSLYGKKGSDAGCCIVKTKQCVIVAVYEGGIQAGQCNTVVEKLADYLIGGECAVLFSSLPPRSPLPRFSFVLFHLVVVLKPACSRTTIPSNDPSLPHSLLSYLPPFCSGILRFSSGDGRRLAGPGELTI